MTDSIASSFRCRSEYHRRGDGVWIATVAGIPMAMVLTGLTAIMAAALGGAVAVDATALVVAAVVALVVLGVVNGLNALQELTGYLRT